MTGQQLTQPDPGSVLADGLPGFFVFLVLGLAALFEALTELGGLRGSLGADLAQPAVQPVGDDLP